MTNKKIVLGILIVLMASVVYAEIQWGNPAYSGVWTVSNLPMCRTDNGVKYWENVGNDGLVNREDSVNDCYRADGVDELLVPNDKCCPANKPICRQQQVGEPWKCVSGSIPILSCEDYSPADCGSANDIAKEQLTNSNFFSGTKYSCDYPEGEVGICTESINCVCEVNRGVCKPNAKLIIWNGTYMYTKGINENVDYEAICGATISTGNCFVDIKTVDNCNTTNTKGVSWTVNWTDGTTAQPEYCKSENKNVPCPAQLGFINLASIILAIVLIIILYIIISKKKKVITKKRARVIKKKRR